MSDERAVGICTFLITSLFWILLIIGVAETSYKDGQVNALSGRKIEYRLVMQDDSTKTWEFIEKGK